MAKYNRVYNTKTGNISVDISDSDVERGATKFIVKDCEMNANYISSRQTHVIYTNCKFNTFNGSKMTIKDSVIYPTSYLGGELYFENCQFKNLEEDGGDIIFRFNELDAVRKFDNCKFIGKTSFSNNNYFNSVICNSCTFEDLSLNVGVCGEDNKPGIEFNNCNITSTADNFIYFGPYAYSRGRYNIAFNNSVLNISAGNLIYMYGKPTLDSKVLFSNCTINKSKGALLSGYGTITNATDVALDLRFA